MFCFVITYKSYLSGGSVTVSDETDNHIANFQAFQAFSKSPCIKIPELFELK